MVINKRQKTLKVTPSCRSSPGSAQSRRSRPHNSSKASESVPAGCPVLERRLKTLLIVRRPRVEKRPCQRAGEGGVRLRKANLAEVRRRFQFSVAHACRAASYRVRLQGRSDQTRHCTPGLPPSWPSRWVDSSPRSPARARQRAGEVITIGLAFRRFLHIKNSRMVTGCTAL